MRLTIVAEDRFVSIDGLGFFELDLLDCQVPENVWALQWYGDHGQIEFTDNSPNDEITTLPDWANACIVKHQQEEERRNAPPSDAVVIAQNEEKAKNELSSSDWTQLPSTPLANKDEWDAYRSALRVIATSPTLNPAWPVKPVVVWLTNE
jgi:hypothetical protein